MLRRSGIPYFYLALGILQALHSMEEYATRFWDWFPVVTGYIHQILGLFPILQMSEPVFVTLNMAIITSLLSISPFVFQNRSWAQGLAKLIAVVELVNGLSHISLAILLREYYPGSISAIGLVFLSVLLLLSTRAVSSPAPPAGGGTSPA